MAGDWIKIEHALPNKPEVMAMSDELGISEMEVVGHLVCFWTWVDQNLSEKCPVVSGTKTGLDRVAGRTGFAEAMINAGWLKLENGKVEIPNYEDHLSQTAKSRSVEAKRKQKQRAKMSQDVPDKNGTKRGTEKRREEKKNPPTPLGGVCSSQGFLKYLPREDLGKKDRVLAWAQENVPNLSEDLQVKILECSRRARAIGKDPPKLFLSLVKDGLEKGKWRIDGADWEKESE